MTRAPIGQGVGAPASQDGLLWPVYEFRPLPKDTGSTVLRFADGQWLPDDGEYDLAFVSYGFGAPKAVGVHLPYQRNIIWSGLTTHWSRNVGAHPRGNPWHYTLRDGETEWGGDWGRDRHPNTRAQWGAMSKCCSIASCANGVGPRFESGDRYIAAGLVRERESKRIVTEPDHLHCMYCGDEWQAKADALAARGDAP